MKFTFDTSSLANTNFTAADVYITFAAQSASLTYGSGSGKEEITFDKSEIVIDSKKYGTSKAYSLQDISSNGLVINSATALIAYLSYGSADKIAKQKPGVQPSPFDSSTPRYVNFEITYKDNAGGIDITNISDFGASLKIALLAGDSEQSYVANTLNSTQMFNHLAVTSGYTTKTPSAAVLQDSNGCFVRIIGPNAFPSGTMQTPYPTFNAYLQHLYNTYRTSSVVKQLTNLAPNHAPGGLGSEAYNAISNAVNVTAKKKYNLDYHFDAYVIQKSTPSRTDPIGTYSVQLKGYVNATYAGVPSRGIVESYKYTDLEIEISADDLANTELSMTNFLYQESLTATGVTATSSGWDAINTDFSEAVVDAAMKYKTAGDFAQGILCGFIGSLTESITVPATQLKDLTSYQWWHNADLAYAPAQPDSPYYSAYGNIVFSHSDALLNNTNIPRGGVYGSPYDDRFGDNLLQPDTETTELKVTLMEGGNLQPASPESYYIAAPQSSGPATTGTFYSATRSGIQVRSSDDFILSSLANGKGDIFVDDVVTVTIQNASDKAAYTHDYSNNCSGVVTPTPPVNLNKNNKDFDAFRGSEVSITVAFSDKCKGAQSGSGYWVTLMPDYTD